MRINCELQCFCSVVHYLWRIILHPSLNSSGFDGRKVSQFITIFIFERFEHTDYMYQEVNFYIEKKFKRSKTKKKSNEP